MTEPEGPPTSPREIEDSVHQMYADLFEMNAQIFNASRQQIENVTVLRDAFLLQADKCQEIIELYAMGAELSAKSTGDLLLNQLGLMTASPSPQEEEQDEPDDD